MLTFGSKERFRDCDGVSRRNFLRVGGLGLSALGLPALVAAEEAKLKPKNGKSVIWVWLGGGPTHVETFDPKMSAPVEYRSTTGEVPTNVPGLTLGGNFHKLAKVADKMTFVRSFAHKNSGHGGGTHWLMTGYDNRGIDNGGLPSRPSIGSITAKHRGTNSPSGVPTYVRLNGIGSDGPAFLGAAYSPFDPNGQAKRNMKLEIPMDRLNDRRNLLSSLDRTNRQADQSGLMDGLDSFEQQAFKVILGDSNKAFDYKLEDPRVVERFGGGLGQQLLLSRRLVEAGVGFVTVQYGGWDMHGQIKTAMDRRAPQLDHAVAALIEDLDQRGLSDDVLVVVTGEFGRTPKVNGNAGRDHWAPLSTLALSGGKFTGGKVIGRSDNKVSIPATDPVGPEDLMASVFDHLEIPRELSYINQAGRPVFMIENGKPIVA